MIPNRNSPNVFADVRRFIDIAQSDLRSELNHKPQDGAMVLAKQIINEEVNKELLVNLEKLINGDFSLELLAEVLDDAVDSIYVIAWLIEILSLPGEAAWNEVQRANMSKFPLADGFAPPPQDASIEVDVQEVTIPEEPANRWVLRNKLTQKIVKPEGFVPPNIHEVVLQILTMRKLRSMPNVIADPFMREYFNETERRIEAGEIKL